MARPVTLLFSSARFGTAASAEFGRLSSCEEGIPLGWLFLFGSRNLWEPGDNVEQRGGRSSERNRFESPIEQSQIRLDQVITTIGDAAHAWVWLAPLKLLHRRLEECGKAGYLRLDANWAFKDDRLRARLIQTTALLENAVNQISVGNYVQAGRALAPLDEFCPFVPHLTAEDRSRFAAVPFFKNHEPARKAARLIVGEPAGELDQFDALVDEEYGPVFAGVDSLPPYPGAPAGKAAPAVAAKPAAPAAAEGKKGVVSKLMGLFKR